MAQGQGQGQVQGQGDIIPADLIPTVIENASYYELKSLKRAFPRQVNAYINKAVTKAKEQIRKRFVASYEDTYPYGIRMPPQANTAQKEHNYKANYVFDLLWRQILDIAYITDHASFLYEICNRRAGALELAARNVNLVHIGLVNEHVFESELHAEWYVGPPNNAANLKAKTFHLGFTNGTHKVYSIDGMLNCTTGSLSYNRQELEQDIATAANYYNMFLEEATILTNEN